MSNVKINKVLIVTERTSGVPPVILFSIMDLVSHMGLRGAGECSILLSGKLGIWVHLPQMMVTMIRRDEEMRIVEKRDKLEQVSWCRWQTAPDFPRDSLGRGLKLIRSRWKWLGGQSVWQNLIIGVRDYNGEGKIKYLTKKLQRLIRDWQIWCFFLGPNMM